MLKLSDYRKHTHRLPHLGLARLRPSSPPTKLTKRKHILKPTFAKQPTELHTTVLARVNIVAQPLWSAFLASKTT